ncbi:putative LPS assembly protein LptD [Arundinibacter roseus]|uniref:LPS-assembly protein LptD n=1 Tax=Arundinibacter roseus TaxID=2070510 RepID=A0A4R4KB23_9BACT|nr:putative LPS assembly protein LptD [Arundinibacter roseus]TDB63631.1 LPS-assembly protein LptD [Arundinibacter roseus]
MLQLKNIRFSIWLCLWVFLLTEPVFAQQQSGRSGSLFRKDKKTDAKTPADTAVVPRLALPTDTLPATDTTGIRRSGLRVTTDSTTTDSLSSTSDLQSTVEYHSEDSTITDVEKRQVHLYGDAEVKYGTIQLKAAYIRIDWTTNEIFAEGRYDSTAKKTIGEPIFQDGPESYNTRELRYNYKTKKGFIRGVVTQQGEGNIRGDKVKKDDEGNLYIRGSIYTTCNLTHPHFFINAPKIKLIDNKQVVSGPFNLVIADVPLPVGLPFGFFPFPKKKETGTSGILFPAYGEEPNGRGFFLRDGGYYFAVSEYFNASVTGQIYSTGSWGLGVSSVYTKRYRYNGNVALRFNRNRSGDELDKLLNRPGRNDFSVIWSHSPVPRGNSNFSANVNVTSNSFNQFNALDNQRYISNVASSSVQYNRTFGQYARAGASLRVNQNFGQVNTASGRRENGKTDVSTQFNFGINQIAPFALNGGRGRWYESFRLGLDFNGNYSVNNSLSAIDTSFSRLGFVVVNAIDTSRVGGETILPFDLNNLPALLRDAQFTGRYSLPISLPNFKLLRFVNFTPSLSLQGEVFTKQYNYRYLGDNRVQIDTLNKVGSEYSYSFGAGMNTRFYGTFQIQGKRLEAIRHTVIPSISFSYTPDFSGDNFGFYQRIQINELGDSRFLSRYRGIGNSFTSSDGRASGVISYSLNNSFEMKLRSKSDTANQQFEKVSLLDNLSFGGSYNLMADSLNLSNISINANARVGQNLNMNFNMTLDPYAYIADPRSASNTAGLKINEFAISRGQGLARLQNMNVALSTSFNPKKKSTEQTTKPANTTATEEQLEFIDRNPDLYVDFNIPWNISLNYNFGLSRFGLQKASLIQTVSATGDLSLTPKWKISLNTGFDFVALSPSITTVSLYRDLHCWDMSFNWTPFAGSQFRASNYSFTLKAKSSILQDLKLTRRRSFYDQSGF